MEITLKDFEGRMEDIKRRGRGIQDSYRDFFILTEVAAVADEKLSKKNNKKKRVKHQKGRASGANPPPDMPQEFKNRIQEMGGTMVKLIIQKQLFEADLKKGQGRMSIPVNQILCHNFLTDKEKELLNKPDECGKRKAIKTTVIGPNVTEETTNMNFKKWDMKKPHGSVSSSYVLTTKWNSLVAINPSTLKVDNTIQLWSYRQEGELCFALVVLGLERGADGDDS